MDMKKFWNMWQTLTEQSSKGEKARIQCNKKPGRIALLKEYDVPYDPYDTSSIGYLLVNYEGEHFLQAIRRMTQLVIETLARIPKTVELSDRPDPPPKWRWTDLFRFLSSISPPTEPASVELQIVFATKNLDAKVKTLNKLFENDEFKLRSKVFDVLNLQDGAGVGLEKSMTDMLTAYEGEFLFLC